MHRSLALRSWLRALARRFRPHARAPYRRLLPRPRMVLEEFEDRITPAPVTFLPTTAGFVNWNTPGNWSTGLLPGPADDVIIPERTSVTQTIQISGGASVSVNSITAGVALHVANGSLAVAGNVTMSGGADLTINNGFTGTVSVGGSVTGADWVNSYNDSQVQVTGNTSAVRFDVSQGATYVSGGGVTASTTSILAGSGTVVQLAGTYAVASTATIHTGATLRSATIGAGTTLTANQATFDAATVALGAVLNPTGNFTATVVNGLTVNGEVRINTASTNTVLAFSGSQAVVGSGSIVFTGVTTPSVTRGIGLATTA